MSPHTWTIARLPPVPGRASLLPGAAFRCEGRLERAGVDWAPPNGAQFPSPCRGSHALGQMSFSRGHNGRATLLFGPAFCAWLNKAIVPLTLIMLIWCMIGTCSARKRFRRTAQRSASVNTPQTRDNKHRLPRCRPTRWTWPSITGSTILSWVPVYTRVCRV